MSDLPRTSDSTKPSIHRPDAAPGFYRAHGLGNDYLVVRGGDALPGDAPRWPTTPEAVARVCHRTEGVGSDGVIVVCSDTPPFRLRGFNPDGSEFERSGNGLRIVASWLHRQGWVGAEPFQALIGGDTVIMQIHAADPATGLYDISVEMGRAVVGAPGVEFDPAALGRDGQMRLRGGAPVGDAGALADLPPLDLTLVSVGNPHAVVWNEGVQLAEFGNAVATHPAFANGTNVQLARVTARGSSPAGHAATGHPTAGHDTAGVDEGDETAAGGALYIEIWERGVGPTSASGSSSCACAVAAVHTGRLNPGEIRVRMPGGELTVTVSTELDVLLRGPVQAVAQGRMDGGFLAGLDG